jgi:Ca2+/Na+ antiporter
MSRKQWIEGIVVWAAVITLMVLILSKQLGRWGWIAVLGLLAIKYSYGFFVRKKAKGCI